MKEGIDLTKLIKNRNRSFTREPDLATKIEQGFISAKAPEKLDSNLDLNVEVLMGLVPKAEPFLDEFIALSDEIQKKIIIDIKEKKKSMSEDDLLERLLLLIEKFHSYLNINEKQSDIDYYSRPAVERLEASKLALEKYRLTKGPKGHLKRQLKEMERITQISNNKNEPPKKIH